ncbi:MAG: hypothetical protein ACFFD1_04915 [Candidatus Thorarchaeota archaeon]
MTNKNILINLKRDRPIINILGEVCWGFKVENFEKKFGVKLEIVEKLLERLIREEKKGIVDVYLSISDIEIIKKSLVEVKRKSKSGNSKHVSEFL